MQPMIEQSVVLGHDHSKLKLIPCESAEQSVAPMQTELLVSAYRHLISPTDENSMQITLKVDSPIEVLYENGFPQKSGRGREEGRGWGRGRGGEYIQYIM